MGKTRLKNLTPEKYSCIGGIGCPSVYSSDSGTLIVVGKRLDHDDPRLLNVVRKSTEEEIIEIPKDLLMGLYPCD